MKVGCMALSHSYDRKIKKRIGFVVRLVRGVLENSNQSASWRIDRLVCEMRVYPAELYAAWWGMAGGWDANP